MWQTDTSAFCCKVGPISFTDSGHRTIDVFVYSSTYILSAVI